MYLRWPSAKMVSKASELFPDPETPVITTSWSRGMSTSSDLRLCSAAPRTLMDFTSANRMLPIGCPLCGNLSWAKAKSRKIASDCAARARRSDPQPLDAQLPHFAALEQQRGKAQRFDDVQQSIDGSDTHIAWRDQMRLRQGV